MSIPPAGDKVLPAKLIFLQPLHLVNLARGVISCCKLTWSQPQVPKWFPEQGVLSSCSRQRGGRASGP